MILTVDYGYYERFEPTDRRKRSFKCTSVADGLQKLTAHVLYFVDSAEKYQKWIKDELPNLLDNEAVEYGNKADPSTPEFWLKVLLRNEEEYYLYLIEVDGKVIHEGEPDEDDYGDEEDWD